jgi:DNA modification methylase
VLTGFDAEEIELTLAAPAGSSPGGDPDEAGALGERAVSKRGDVWLCGPHRIGCGDATSAKDVRALFAGLKPNLMVTDAPYGISYDAGWRNKALRSADRAVGKVNNDGRADWREAWDLFPGTVAYVWHSGLLSHVVGTSLVAAGFDIRAQLIWAKPRMVISRGNYHIQHEPVYYAVRQGETANWRGDRKQNSVWQIEHLRSETGHSTRKPIECMRRPIENSSKRGDAVYDPFCGSGTTLIAATMTDRLALALDIDELYVDVAVRRWQSYTGQMAKLQGDDCTFEAVAAERTNPKAA